MIRFAAFLFGLMAFCSAHTHTIAIIGTGDVGSALGTRFAGLGHSVVYGSRTPEEAAVQTLVNETGNGARAATQAESVIGADIVVLAIPWAPAKSIVQSLGNLDGKIIIDPINAMAFGENRMISPAAFPSAAALIQEWAPGAYVVKAFNTLTRAYMVDPGAAGGPITIPVAGNNADAKAAVADLVRSLGLEPMDVGGLENAAAVEAMGLLYVAQGYQGRNRFEYHLRPR
jgi:NADPH-dependent F420 reductase